MKTKKPKIELLEPMDGGVPTHYILNNASAKSLNTTYNDDALYEEAKRLEPMYNGVENIITGEMKDLDNYEVILVNELSICGGESKVVNNNKANIL